MPESQKPNGTVAGSTERLASRFYQLKTGHCLSGQYLKLDEEPDHPAVLVVPVPESNPGAPLCGVPGVEGPTEGTVGGGVDVDERFSQAILDFLASTDV